MLNVNEVSKVYREGEKMLFNEHYIPFRNTDRHVVRISDWYSVSVLEHLYDAIMMAKLYPEYKQVAEDTARIYFDNQRPNGQYPYAFVNEYHPEKTDAELAKYDHIQECVSIGPLCMEIYNIIGSKEFLKDAYESISKWDGYIRSHRMTLGKGLVEMFCGFDTGHDQSHRLDGMAYDGDIKDGKIIVEAQEPRPQDDEVSPIIAADMSANLFGNDMALAEMADLLGKPAEAAEWRRKAAEIKAKLFEICFDEEDAFFYDVDRNGNKRKIKSCTIFHFFFEGVLDRENDAALIKKMYEMHIHNPEEFWTPYPFPAVAANDPGFDKKDGMNSWSYYVEATTVLRCTRWMDWYGFGRDFDHVCEKYVEGWTRCFDKFKLAQELDPITGEYTLASESYSAGILAYLYAVRRLGIVDSL